MTEKQKKFCVEYLIDCNATQAAIRAGYSPKTAYSIGEQNLKKPEIRAYIDLKLKEMESTKIATATEVMEYLTSVLRGQSNGTVLTTEFLGGGVSEARLINKTPDEKEKLKAAELIGKRHGLFTEKLEVSNAIPVVIREDLDDE